MAWEPITYSRASSAETISYRITPPGHIRGSVLFVHGAGNDALFGIVGLGKRLLKEGLRVAAFDLDGHGRTSTTKFSAASIGSAIQEALDQLCGDSPGPVHGIGVSLGGSILLHALGTARPQMASAVLMAAPLQIRFSAATVLPEFRPHLLRTLWREREHYGLVGLIPSFGPFKRQTYPLRLADSGAAGSFSYIDTLNRALDAMDLEGAAARVDLPVLLVHGDADRVVPIKQGERLAQLMPSAEVLRVHGGTHLTTPFEPVVMESVLRWIVGNSDVTRPLSQNSGTDRLNGHA